MRRPERLNLVTRTTAPSSTITVPTERMPAPDSHQAPSSPATKTHRLHPGRQRRLSDASIEKPLSGSPRKKHPPRPAREPGPPPSMRGFSAIPPVPTIPPLPRPADASHGVHNYSSMASSSSSLGSNESLASNPMTTSYHSRKTPNSSVSSTGSSASYETPQPQPTSIPPSAAREFVFPFSNESTSTLQTNSAPAGARASSLTREPVPREPEQSAPSTAPPPSRQPPVRIYHTTNPQLPAATTKPKNYYPPKVARFTESVTEVAPQPRSQSQPRPARPTNWLTRRFSSSSRVSVDEAPGPEPPEPGSIAEAAERASGKKGKAKPTKLVKRSRWSSG